MNKRALIVLVMLLAIIAESLPCVMASEKLPLSLRIDLKRLEETWSILDQYAERVWPGWTNYRTIPFLFEYPNGVRMLVGHPDPTDDFALLPGVEVSGRKVYLDRRHETALPLDRPLLGGGGLSSLGKTRRIPTVQLKMSEKPIGEQSSGARHATKGSREEEVLRRASENQILINIHELFHCFLPYRSRFDNLRFNPDANYAIYAEIEGLALERAWLEKDSVKSKERIKEFLAARALKRRSLQELEQKQESEWEVIEGSAVFAETMVLQLMESGYRAGITSGDDPGFGGFAKRSWFVDYKLKELRKSRADTMDSERKCYDFGNFMALLLTRHVPQWRERVSKENTTLDEIIRAAVGMSGEEQQAVAGRLENQYPLAEISARHNKAIAQRDEAYEAIGKRVGKAFVVDFKPGNEFLNPTWRGDNYKLGLINIYPRGIEKLRVQSATLSGRETPMMLDQFYYVKWVDTESAVGNKGYTIKYSRMEDEGVYYDAEFSCGGFTLKAPQIQIRESPKRVKIVVLKKV